MKEMKRLCITIMILLGFLCGCRKQHGEQTLTYAFPTVTVDRKSEGRIFMFEAKVNGGQIESLLGIPEDWIVGTWSEGAFMPHVWGSARVGAAQLSDTASFPRIVVVKDSSTSKPPTVDADIFCTTDYDITTSDVHRVKLVLED